MKPPEAVLALLVLGVSACERTHDENLRSLVDDGNLPVVAVGKDETVIVSLVKPGAGAHENVEYALTTDGRLTVRRLTVRTTVMDEPKIELQGSETTRLSADQANNLRRRLATYRPVELTKDWPGVLPRDCTPIADGTARAVVLFRRPDDKGGLFELQKGCDNANAARLVADIRQIVSTLSKTKPAAGFDW